MTLKTKEGLQVGSTLVIGTDGLLDYAKLKNVPALAPISSPVFTGTVTAPTFSGNLAGNATTSNTVVATVTGTTSTELVRGNMADNDQFRILVGGTASNSGYAEIATADDGNEPIYVRQYTGIFSSLIRTAALLDGSGNTSFPGTVTAPTFSGNLSGNASTASRIGFSDRRSTVITPSYFGAGVDWSFVANGTDGLTDGGGFHGVMHYQPYNDATGGGSYQIGFTGNNNMWLRGSSNALTSWSAWKRVIDSSSIGGYSPSLTGTGSSGTWPINVTGSSNLLVDGGFKRITNPGGGEFTATTETYTGAIRITLPVGMLDTMIHITVKIYNYITNEAFELSCGGYTYAAANTWEHKPFAYIVGNPDIDRRFNIRFGYTTAGKAVIYIGELSTIWKYPQIFITDVLCGYAGQQSAYSTGWNIGFEATAFQSVTATIGNSQVGYRASSNVVNSYVYRDASGNFAANLITAYDFSGNGSGLYGTASGLHIGGNALTSTTAARISSADGDRLSSTKLPSSSPNSVRFDFVHGAQIGSPGSTYAGLMTYAPWVGTAASTGDASYQIAFGSTTTNGNGQPRLKIRNGIDSTWNTWYDIWTSSSLTNLNQLSNGPGYTSNAGTVTSVAAGWPLSSTGGTAPTISIPAATTSAAGYLSNNDWNNFNNKANTSSPAFSGNTTAANLNVTGVLTSKAAPLTTVITGANVGSIEIPQTNTGAGGFATALHQTTVITSGYCTHLSLGTYRAGNAWGGGFFVGLGGHDAYPTENYILGFGGEITHSSGKTYLNSSNYNTYAPTKTGTGASGNWPINSTNVTGTVAIANGGTGATTAALALAALGAYPASNPNNYSAGGMSAVTATAPVISSGGTAPVISMPAATTSANGYLTAANWNTFNNKANVNAPTFTGTVTAPAFNGDIVTKSIYSNTSGTSYSAAAQIREPNLGGGGTGDMAGAPRLGFHWGGRVASSIAMETSGRICINNNPGTGYEDFGAQNIYAAANVVAYSDERLKTNWRDLSPDFVHELSKVKVGIYDRLDIDLTQVGVSAQSLRKVLPDAVNEDTNAEKTLSVSYGNAALASAIELAKEIVILKADNELFKQTITKMHADIEALKLICKI